MGRALQIRDDLSAAELRLRARREKDGRAAARMIAIANALEGMSRAEAARLAGMERQALRDAVVRYNAEGLDGLHDRPRAGPGEKLDEGQQAALVALILAGPDRRRDGTGVFRLKDLVALVERRFGVRYSVSGMFDLLRRLGISWMSARPRAPARRRKGAAGIQKNFAETCRAIARAHPEAERVEVWFADESRVGQKGRLTRRWWARGFRPRGTRDQRFRSAWIFGAACPERDTAEALVTDHVSTAAMNAFLALLSQAVPDGTHAIVVMDQAGWHVAHGLAVPSNLTLVPLPPYSPELNPIERVWRYLKDVWLSNRVFPDLAAVVDACCQAWRALLAETGRIRSICTVPWARVTT